MITLAWIGLLIFGILLIGIVLLTDEDGSGLILLLFAGLCVMGSWSIYRNQKFEQNKITVYEKPKISVIIKTENSIKYLIDDEKVHTFSEMKWLDHKKIWWEVEYYNSRTNRKLVVRKKK